MSGKYYATNTTDTFSTTMIIVMINGGSSPSHLRIGALIARAGPFSDWQEHSTVERNPANRHGWLSGAIRAMSANRPTRRRDHRKGGWIPERRNHCEHENIRKVECSPANGSIVPTDPDDMDEIR
ncbi:hypothetical protein AlacWU_01886 [Aspergillus niger]|nr:hypothetical protein AlacWU_01886 [Aspergillus niger]